MSTNASINRFTIYRGTAPILRFTVDLTTIDVTDPASGWASKYTIRTAPNAASYVLQLAGVWNATTSTIDVKPTRAQTLALAAGAYVGALFRTNSGSEDELSRDVIIVAEGIYDAP